MDSPPLIDEPPERGPSHVLRSIVFVLAMFGAGIVTSFVVSTATAAPAHAMIRGIDVSSWQHPGTTSSRCGSPIDWGAVQRSGITFAYVKSTQATGYTNPCFAQDWAGIANAGMLRGSYHYAEPALPISTAVDQARYFVSRAGSMTGPGDLPAMLDLEETGGLNATDLSNWTRAFLNEVTLLTGKKPVLYMGAYFFPGTIAADISANYRLWIPSYVCQTFSRTRIDGCDPATRQPRLPTGWSTWTFWQWSSIEPVPGIVGGVDMNYFCCDLGSLGALAGAGAGAGSPFGALDSVSMVGPSTVAVGGWAIDPDSRDPIAVHVYVDGVPYGVNASGDRPDVGDVYPGFGDSHGYFTTVSVPLDARQVCVYAINVSSGGNSPLGCRQLGGSPLSSLDSVSVIRPGRIGVSGWTYDPNDPARSSSVHVYVGGQPAAVTASQARPDVNAAFGVSGSHGLSAQFDVSGGSQQVCVYAINEVGPGSNVPLGCRTVVLLTGSPFGSVDGVFGRSGAIDVAGWAIDPDTANPSQVHIYVDGVPSAVVADRQRPDLVPVFPGYGAAHGYAASFAAGAGTHQVCVFAIDVAGPGGNSLLGCRSVSVPSPEPFGALDSVTATYGSITINGWAIDPDTSGPTSVHVYVDGAPAAVSADRWRGDLASVFPAYGGAHGFSATLAAPAGKRQVCAYAINLAGAGSNRGIGCRTVTVPDPSPFGSLDSVSRSGGSIRVAGWAIDPETTAPIAVHVYVNNVVTGVLASADRPDVGAIFGRGSQHGFDTTVAAVGGGSQSVCVFAIDVGSGLNTLLGCREV